MRILIVSLSLAVLLAPAFAQADFELQLGACGASFPIGKGAVGDPEGISWNGNGLCTVDGNGPCGFPTSGAGFLRLRSTNGGPTGEMVPPGVPPTALSGTQAEAYVPVPPGAVLVSLAWDFYSPESPNSGFNDGMLIDLIDAACNQLTVLAFADVDTTAQGTCADSGACLLNSPVGFDQGPADAPEQVLNVPVPVGAAWVRIAVWNAPDDNFPSIALLDDVAFAFTAPIYPGTNEDLITEYAVGAGPVSTVMGGTDVVAVNPGDFMSVRHSSPLGTFTGVGDLIVIGSTLPTGMALPFIFPGLHIELTTAFLLSPTVFGIPPQLPPFGFSYAFVYPGGALAGLSLYLQGIVSTATAASMIFASTNALEMQLL